MRWTLDGVTRPGSENMERKKEMYGERMVGQVVRLDGRAGGECQESL
jgi:hypothetical protein